MSDWTVTSTLALACALVLYVGKRAFSRPGPYPLPPGPPGLPLLGNLIGINASAPWITYADWARKYGDIVHSRLLGKDIIIVNSEKIAIDLMEKRSNNYSDRIQLAVMDLYGTSFVTPLLPYGDRWRLHRRFFHQTFRLDPASRFLPVQHEKACRFLLQLLDAPDELKDHVFEYTASLILKSTYDYDTSSRKDEVLDIVANVLDNISAAARPDAAIVVSVLPFLLHLPSWFPGMSFLKEMETARNASKVYLNQPFEHSLRRVEKPSDDIAPSMVRDGLQIIEGKQDPSEEYWLETLKEAAGSAFLVASETSDSVLLSFFLMMMLNPACQEKAQLQIDSVVGKGRIPGIDDRPFLPFIDAIFRETLRYSPVLPLCVPHVSVSDDVYNGFYIPKGTLLLANAWSMAHDESRYPNSHAFIPERFLNEDGSLKPNDLEHIAFGFGRRMCTGRHFADTSVWAAIAKVLAVFKILKPLDENGVEITIEPKFSSGITIHPLPFKCRIVPRTPGLDVRQLKELIAASVI